MKVPFSTSFKEPKIDLFPGQRFWNRDKINATKVMTTRHPTKGIKGQLNKIIIQWIPKNTLYYSLITFITELALRWHSDISHGVTFPKLETSFSRLNADNWYTTGLLTKELRCKLQRHTDVGSNRLLMKLTGWRQDATQKSRKEVTCKLPLLLRMKYGQSCSNKMTASNQPLSSSCQASYPTV